MRYLPPLLIWLTQLTLLLGSLAATQIASGALQYSLNLAIASVMAALTAMYFMRLNLATGIIRLFALGGLLWLAFLIALSLLEWATRSGVN